MEHKVLEFKVNGAIQKIEAKVINEVFIKDGIRTTISTSGRKILTDKYSVDGKWVHKEIFDKNGNLDCELVRSIYDDGKLISLCEDHDNSKKTTIYEYDEYKNVIHQYSEILQKDGSAKKCEEFWFSNYYDSKVDEAKLKENTIYKEFKNNLVVRLVESGFEVKTEYDLNGNVLSMTTLKDGKISCKTSYQKSDEGMIEITKSENFQEKSVYYEIIDNRKSEKKDCVSVTYMATIKM